MKIIGITGGVGSGKSRVLSFLETEYDAYVCQADHVAWQLQRPGEKCYHAIIELFGKDILSADETIDRQKLGNIVFGNDFKLMQLNQIMHPAVKKFVQEQIQIQYEKGTDLFVLEAALLLEEHYDEICDELWYIYTDEQIRRERLKESRQYTDEKIDAIMASQVSDKEFRRGCQCVINNSGTFEETCTQIKRILDDRENRA